jgi:hypothetical protein
MNTASNWPMGSTLADLNLELKNVPFPIGKSSINKNPSSATEIARKASVSNASSSLNTVTVTPKSVSKTPEAIVDAIKWTQTR